MKSYINSIIFGIAIITAAGFLGKAYVDRNNPEGIIQVTGLGKKNFTSDLIVWEGEFKAQNYDLQQAFVNLNKYKEKVTDYLIGKGIPENEIVFNSVQTTKKSRQKYSPDGKYLGNEFSGYELSQSLSIESSEVNKIEKISREITELLKKGVQFYSYPPRYYYTQLADLKIEMISEATKDAHMRAQKIAEYSGGSLGELKSAKMGIFQIVGQNSAENYSWGGTFNTSSKKKTASITMKLQYKVK